MRWVKIKSTEILKAQRY